jgi:hypothetical protein
MIYPPFIRILDGDYWSFKQFSVSIFTFESCSFMLLRMIVLAISGQ